MFETTKTRASRLADAVDLLIDFATLGEYGLEPVTGSDGRDCQRRTRSTGESAIRFAPVDRRDHLPAHL